MVEAHCRGKGKKLAKRYDFWFRISHHTGKTVAQCQKEYTELQALAYSEWLHNEFEVPSRSDYYIMQLTSIVFNMMSENKEDVNSFKMAFNSKEKVLSDEQRAKFKQHQLALIKSRWNTRIKNATPKESNNGVSN